MKPPIGEEMAAGCPQALSGTPGGSGLLLRSTGLPGAGQCLGLATLRVGVKPDASLQDLMADTMCLLISGLDALEQVSDHIGTDNVPAEVSDAWWSMLYTLRLAREVFGHAHDKAHQVGRSQPAAPSLAPAGGAR